ncbi:MAG: PmoA family protein [Akkermansiaceae bacterium]|nr:PmoA family protein [Akkermansiaceae bacterium]
MKNIHAGVLILCLISASIPLRAQEKLAAAQIGSRIDVTIGGKFFTSYRFAADEKYPFFFPVNGPSGASVTSMRNGEYPHHSSLFFGCDMVNGGNYWQEALDRGRIVSKGPVLEVASGNEIIIRDTCDWTRPGAPQPFRDTRRIIISAPSPTLRQIDFEITLEATEEVVIRKTNHSLFSSRMDPDLTPVHGGTMLNADGDKGEKGTFGKPSPWLACFGADYGFLSPTPMFWPANGKDTPIAKGEKLRLGYRVLVFSGTPETAGIAANFKEFSGAKPNPTK